MLWADLNERQQQYLQAIYDQDQENERDEKSQWTRGYLLCRYKTAVIGDPLVCVQITPKGRKLVRSATGAQREQALPPGTLREWHWRAMVEAWKGRPEGVMAITWLRLGEYRDGPLIEEYQTPG